MNSEFLAKTFVLLKSKLVALWVRVEAYLLNQNMSFPPNVAALKCASNTPVQKYCTASAISLKMAFCLTLAYKVLP